MNKRLKPHLNLKSRPNLKSHPNFTEKLHTIDEDREFDTLNATHHINKFHFNKLPDLIKRGKRNDDVAISCRNFSVTRIPLTLSGKQSTLFAIHYNDKIYEIAHLDTNNKQVETYLTQNGVLKLQDCPLLEESIDINDEHTKKIINQVIDIITSKCMKKQLTPAKSSQFTEPTHQPHDQKTTQQPMDDKKASHALHTR